MTDIERAHSLVIAHYPEIAPSYTGSPVQIALAAIQSERERAKVLVEALRRITDIADQHAVPFKGTARELRDRSTRLLAVGVMMALPDIRKALAAYGDGHE